MQNRYLFSATRNPGLQIDESRNPYSAQWPGPSDARHIVVFRRGQAYEVTVRDEAGADLPAFVVAEALDAIRTQDQAGPGLGALTTLPRAEWSVVRDGLLQGPSGIAESLDVIERALFAVALEDDSPASTEAAADALLAGDSRNRWFDKAITLIVFADGQAGLNGEHCNLDGTTVIGLVDHLAAAEVAGDDSVPSGGLGADAPGPRALWSTLEPELADLIDRARHDFDRFAAESASRLVQIDELGSDQIRAAGVSPDAFVQLAMQLAQARSRGAIGATYESISTRPFRHGRTEAMRVVTPEIVDFVATMQRPDASAQDKRAAFDSAAAAHGSRVRECQQGDAPEQHLWALQMLAEQQPDRYPDPMPLFSSPGWLVMRDDRLSTSGVPSVNVQYFGFGATSPTCIGVGYGTLPDCIRVYLSTPQAVADQMDAFAVAFSEAVEELFGLVTST